MHSVLIKKFLKFTGGRSLQISTIVTIQSSELWQIHNNNTSIFLLIGSLGVYLYKKKFWTPLTPRSSERVIALISHFQWNRMESFNEGVSAYLIEKKFTINFFLISNEKSRIWKNIEEIFRISRSCNENPGDFHNFQVFEERRKSWD